MNCPICNIELKPADRGGIEIDYCPRNIKFPVAEGTRFPVFGSNASLVVSTKLPFGDGTKVPKGWQPPRFAEDQGSIRSKDGKPRAFGNGELYVSRAIVDLDASAIGWLEFDVANGTIHDACLRRSREGRCRHQIGSVGKRDDSTNLNLISQDWQVRCLHYCVLGDRFGVVSVSVALQNEALAASEQMQVANSAVQL